MQKVGLIVDIQTLQALENGVRFEVECFVRVALQVLELFDGSVANPLEYAPDDQRLQRWAIDGQLLALNSFQCQRLQSRKIKRCFVAELEALHLQLLTLDQPVDVAIKFRIVILLQHCIVVEQLDFLQMPETRSQRSSSERFEAFDFDGVLNLHQTFLTDAPLAIERVETGVEYQRRFACVSRFDLISPFATDQLAFGSLVEGQIAKDLVQNQRGQVDHSESCYRRLSTSKRCYLLIW